MTDDDNLVVATFRADTIRNEAKSKAAGRPIYDDIEVCELRFPGDTQRVSVFPAHAFHRWKEGPDGQEEQTYAQRWNRQYLRFKEGRQQVQEGTPVEELTFLAESKRRELKAMSIHTAETLAALDGNRLKALGMGGREMKDQAQAYLDAAAGSADVTRLAAENAALRERLALFEQSADLTPEPEDEGGDDDPASRFDAMEDGDIKAWIKDMTGQAPRGNPGHETLVAMAEQVASETEPA